MRGEGVFGEWEAVGVWDGDLKVLSGVGCGGGGGETSMGSLGEGGKEYSSSGMQLSRKP